MAEGLGCLLMFVGFSILLMTLFAMAKTEHFIRLVEALT